LRLRACSFVRWWDFKRQKPCDARGGRMRKRERSRVRAGQRSRVWADQGSRAFPSIELPRLIDVPITHHVVSPPRVTLPHATIPRVFVLNACA
jgi:hypothetical protein